MARRSSWAINFKTMRGAWSKLLRGPYQELSKAMPESSFGQWDEKGEFEVPLIDLLDNPAEVIERFISFPFDDQALSLKLFDEYRVRLRSRIADASGMSLVDMAKRKTEHRPAHGAEKQERARTLGPVLGRDAVRRPLRISGSVLRARERSLRALPRDRRHGARQDTTLAKDDPCGPCSVAIRPTLRRRDRQSGDMLQKLSRLELFSPYVPGGWETGSFSLIRRTYRIRSP